MSKIKGPVNVDLAVNVDVDGTNFVDKVLTNPLAAMSNTFTSIWNITFGWVSVYSKKKNIQQQQNLKIFRELVEKEISDLEPIKVQEPTVSILGPAIQSSEFFFEESHYREMFSKIIAGSFNSDYNDILHPSFAKIITELSKNDAAILKYIHQLRDDSDSLKARRLEIVFYSDLPKDSLYPFSVITKRRFADLDPLEVNLSFSNLERLNLITISTSLYSGEFSNDNQFTSAPLIKELKNQHPNIRYRVHPIQINLTTLGKSFSSICLK